MACADLYYREIINNGKHVAEKFKEHGIDHSFYWGSL